MFYLANIHSILFPSFSNSLQKMHRVACITVCVVRLECVCVCVCMRTCMRVYVGRGEGIGRITGRVP